MKKNIFLSILGSCLGIGIVLIIIGMALGARFHNFNLSISPLEDDTDVSHTLPGISLTDTRDIQSLDFDLSAGTIKICYGDTFSIKGGHLSKNEISGNTWKVTSRHSYGISFFGKRVYIPLPHFIYSEDSKKTSKETITITIPENITLEQAEMDLKAVDIDIEALRCEKDVEIEVSAGDLTIDSVEAAQISLDLSAGDVCIKEYKITDEAICDCSLGNITFGTNKYAEQNVCNNLEADCSLGNIDIYGKLTGKNILDCSMGDITLNLIGTYANYNIDGTDTSLGDINFSTKNFLHGKDITVQESHDTSKFGSLDLSCTMGNIDVYYLYDGPINAD